VTKAPSILLHFVAFLIYHAFLRFSMQRQKVLHFSHIVPSFSCNLPINFFRLAFFLRLCRACIAAGLFLPFLCTENAFEEKGKKTVDKSLSA